MRLCSGAGCGRKVPDGQRFCDECRAERCGAEDDGIAQHGAPTTDRERYAALYTGNRFQDGIRPKILSRDPFCARCGRAPSVIVDHIVPAGEAMRQVQESGRFPFDKSAGFYLLSNLQGLCRKCHATKTEEDKAHTGEWPSVLEKADAAPKKRWSL